MEQTFRQFSKDVVAAFLQTVVVLDDGAYIDPVDSIEEVAEPDETQSIPEETESDTPPVSAHSPNALDARTLISSFAERGLVCGVLLPWKDDYHLEPTILASKRADIVILDWQLGDEGQKATSIIKALLDEDIASGGRLRMIVVYTAKPDLEVIRATVAEAVGNLQSVEAHEGALALTRPHTRIVFISKGKTSEISKTVEEGDLAERLINEFVELGSGVLANVALGAISAIRDETHNVLARFHPGLDAPFLSHRILLVTPDDAEGFAVDLLTSEFQSVLHGRGLGRTHAGPEVIEAALKEIAEDGGQFRLMTQKNIENPSAALTADQLMKLVEGGPKGLAEIEGVNSGSGAQATLFQRVYLLRAENMPAGLASHREFSRVSTHSRERTSVAPSWRARLDLGSIVCRGEDYFVCIQPSCDALRLTKQTQFIFAQLHKNESEFDLVVRDAAGAEICLKMNSRAADILTVAFDPAADTQIVLSSDSAGEFTFTSASGDEFSWMCDLRTSIAQRFAHRIANNLSRMGLDEFEWQRRSAGEA